MDDGRERPVGSAFEQVTAALLQHDPRPSLVLLTPEGLLWTGSSSV